MSDLKVIACILVAVIVLSYAAGLIILSTRVREAHSCYRSARRYRRVRTYHAYQAALADYQSLSWAYIVITGLDSFCRLVRDFAFGEPEADEMARSALRTVLDLLRTENRARMITSRQVCLSQSWIQQSIAKGLFCGAFNLVPGYVRDEFGDEPVQHFLDAWGERESGRWAWALAEIMAMCWVAGVERMRSTWQAVTQR